MSWFAPQAIHASNKATAPALRLSKAKSELLTLHLGNTSIGVVMAARGKAQLMQELQLTGKELSRRNGFPAPLAIRRSF